MNQKLILIVAGLLILIAAYFFGKFAERKNAELAKAQSEIKNHKAKALFFQDSIKSLNKILKTDSMKIALLSKENQEFEKKEKVFVTRIIVNPLISYKPTQIDSILRKRYKY